MCVCLSLQTATCGRERAGVIPTPGNLKGERLGAALARSCWGREVQTPRACREKDTGTFLVGQTWTMQEAAHRLGMLAGSCLRWQPREETHSSCPKKCLECGQRSRPAHQWLPVYPRPKVEKGQGGGVVEA